MNKERNRIMAQVVKNLEQVYDPEMPSISVIHLGLIYDIEILENNTVVKITHTLTSAFCPAADSMPRELIQKIEGNMPGFKCKVRITMQPQWGRDMINPEIRDLMGL